MLSARGRGSPLSLDLTTVKQLSDSVVVSGSFGVLMAASAASGDRGDVTLNGNFQVTLPGAER